MGNDVGEVGQVHPGSVSYCGKQCLQCSLTEKKASDGDKFCERWGQSSFETIRSPKTRDSSRTVAYAAWHVALSCCCHDSVIPTLKMFQRTTAFYSRGLWYHEVWEPRAYSLVFFYFTRLLKPSNRRGSSWVHRCIICRHLSMLPFLVLPNSEPKEIIWFCSLVQLRTW
jgi:hypothetical protein